MQLLAGLVLALFLLTTSLPVVHGWTYQYLYTALPAVPDEIDSSWVNWPVAPVVSIADDQGSDVVHLPWTFPFYSSWRTLWLQPNGFLSLGSGDTPCCRPTSECYYLDPLNGCTLNSTDFTNVIMPYMADLDLSEPSSGNVYVRVRTDRLDVRYDQAPLYREGGSGDYFMTFAVTLRPTGQIHFRYYNVSDPAADGTRVDENVADPKTFREWLVGLRGARMTPEEQQLEALLSQWAHGAAYPTVNATNPNLLVADPISNSTYVNQLSSPFDSNFVASSQYSHEQSFWPTSAPGVYPDRGLIATNVAVDFCFLSTEWCLWPTVTNGGTSTTIYLTANELSCARDAPAHRFVCRFHPLLSAGSPTSFDVQATFDADTNTLVCSAPTISSLQASTSSNSNSFRVGLVSLTASNFQPEIFMETPLQLTFDPAVATPMLTSGEALTAFTTGLCTHCSRVNPSYCYQDCFTTYRGNATARRVWRV